MELLLREHQEGVVEKLRQGFRDGHRCQLLYAPTGFGKTEVAIYLMKATADNYHKAAMILDRIVLIDQTSKRLDKYSIAHGVLQAQHKRQDKTRRIQICSSQTIERRNNFPDIDLLIVDECHITRSEITKIIKNNDKIKVIGLTATPFTKELGSIYSNVVCASTTESLVDGEWLCPLKVYISKEIDMAGVKKIAGEWSPDQVTERGMQITGDIVAEWAKKTYEVFGKPMKTIVFCAGVKHGEDLVEQFARKGFNFVSISYKDSGEYKQEVIDDFARLDTNIHGLIATDILTRGFDVPDVCIGISARPFSKSLSSHVQQMGRVMRSHPTKQFGLWLDHSGNYIRFRDDWERIYSEGVKALDDTGEKTKREPTEKEKKEQKCPACSALWPRSSSSCASCGYVRPKKQIETVSGELVELGFDKNAKKDDKQKFYSELIYIANEKNYNINWASHIYKQKFGVWPRGLQEYPRIASLETQKYVKHRTIAFSKRLKKMKVNNAGVR